MIFNDATYYNMRTNLAVPLAGVQSRCMLIESPRLDFVISLQPSSAVAVVLSSALQLDASARPTVVELRDALGAEAITPPSQEDTGTTTLRWRPLHLDWRQAMVFQHALGASESIAVFSPHGAEDRRAWVRKKGYAGL